MKPSSRIVAAACLMLCATLVVGTFRHILWGGEVPIYRDLLLFTVPHKLFLATRLRHGEIPLWNPLINMGTPFLANPQAGVFYPMSLLLLVPFPFGFGLYLVAHYLVAMSGMWALLRRRGLGLLAASVGGITFALGGDLVSMMNLTNHLQGAVWSPWVLLAAMRLFKRPGPRSLVVFSLAIVLQLLAGSPETLLMTLTIVFAWAAYAAAPDPMTVVRAELMLGLGCALAMALTAAQIVPTAEYLRHSPRGAALPLHEVTAWSLQPVSLLQLLIPHTGTLIGGAETSSLGPHLERSLPWILSVYIGIAPLCLAIVGVVYGAERRFWAAVLLAGVLLALGARNPVFVWLYRMLPLLFGKFRFPEKFFFAAHFAAAILAAEGVQQIVRRRGEAERLTYVVSLTFVTVAAALLGLRWAHPERYLEILPVIAGKYLPPWQFVDLAIDIDLKLRRLLSLMGVLLFLLLLHRRVLSPSSFSALLLALVAVDLGSVHGNLNLSMPWNRLQQRGFLVDPDLLRAKHERIFHYQLTAFDEAKNRSVPIAGLTPWAEQINASQDLSFLYEELWRALYPDVGLAVDVAALSGGDAVGRTSDQLLLQSLIHLPRQRAVALARAYGVRLLIGPEALDVPGLERLSPPAPSPFFVYRIPDPCPLVTAVTTLLAEPLTSKAVDTIAQPDFGCEDVAIVSQLPPGWTNARQGEVAHPEASLVSERDDRVRIHVRSQGAAFLVLNESDFPGWTADSDGVPLVIYQTNAFVRGVVVPAGEHTVEFLYRPRSVKIGAAISAFAAVVATLLTLCRLGVATTGELDATRRLSA